MAGYSAYQTAHKAAINPIQMEADIMARVTREMEAIREDTGPARVKALHRNMQLWIALSADLLDDANKLPEQVRASLLSLSIWVEKHTKSVLAGNDTVDALIDVNRSIIAGLFEACKAQQTPPSPQPTQFEAQSA